MLGCIFSLIAVREQRLVVFSSQIRFQEDKRRKKWYLGGVGDWESELLVLSLTLPIQELQITSQSYRRNGGSLLPQCVGSGFLTMH